MPPISTNKILLTAQCSSVSRPNSISSQMGSPRERQGEELMFQQVVKKLTILMSMESSQLRRQNILIRYFFKIIRPRGICSDILAVEALVIPGSLFLLTGVLAKKYPWKEILSPKLKYHHTLLLSALEQRRKSPPGILLRSITVETQAINI